VTLGPAASEALASVTRTHARTHTRTRTRTRTHALTHLQALSVVPYSSVWPISDDVSHHSLHNFDVLLMRHTATCNDQLGFKHANNHTFSPQRFGDSQADVAFERMSHPPPPSLSPNHSHIRDMCGHARSLSDLTAAATALFFLSAATFRPRRCSLDHGCHRSLVCALGWTESGTLRCCDPSRQTVGSSPFVSASLACTRGDRVRLSSTST
jgi:hypothetical protein